MIKNILFLISILPQIWCFAQNSKFEEFNKEYYLAAGSNKDSALVHGFNALKIAKILKNDSLAASAQIAICSTYQLLGNLTSALNYALNAEPYFKKAKSSNGLAVLYIQIAQIYNGLKNHKLAIEYYYKSLTLNNNIPELLVPICLNLGDVYREIEQYDSAIYYFKKAELYGIQHNFNAYNAYLYCNLGLVYSAQEKEIEADSLIKLSFQLLKSNKDFRPIAQTYKELSKIALKNNEIEKAYNYANQAYQIADSNQLVLELKETSLLLSKLNGQKGNYKEAYNFLTTFNDYNQKIASDSVVSKLAEMRAEFEISQNETEMSYLKKISKVRTNLLIVALVGMLAIAALALFLLRLSRMRKEANFQLSEYNEELTQKNDIIDLALQEKDMLMKEIHHRVKNNLQIISSIINLQSMRIEDPETLEIFHEMQRRILAIAGIHQKLYKGNSVSLINMKEYLEEVVESIHSAFNNNQLNVNYEIAIQNVSLNIDAAVAIGLIVNELATNAYKYAFTPNRFNALTLTLAKTPENTIELSLQDNGPGMPNNFQIENSNSLGLRMVNLLIRQNKGKLEYKNDKGTRIEISFVDLEKI
jgi:two-component sensor histidine kinase